MRLWTTQRELNLELIASPKNILYDKFVSTPG